DDPDRTNPYLTPLSAARKFSRTTKTIYDWEDAGRIKPEFFTRKLGAAGRPQRAYDKAALKAADDIARGKHEEGFAGGDLAVVGAAKELRLHKHYVRELIKRGVLTAGVSEPPCRERGMKKLNPAEVLKLKKERREARARRAPKGWKKAREVLDHFRITW